MNRILSTLHRESILALCTRGAFALTFSISLAYVAFNFSSYEKGLFFSFIGFASLVQISDFGLSYAALQMSSHLMATNRAHEVSSLLHCCRLRNTITIVAVAPCIGIFSTASLLAGTQHIDASSDWLEWAGPWGVSLVALFLQQTLIPDFSVTEGTGQAALVWKNRIAQELLGGAVMICALLFGAGLWSLPAYWFTRTACALSLAHAIRSKNESHSGSETHPSSWHGNIWPFQWRMGVNAFTGFLVFQAMTLVVLVELGPDAAGRFGLSLSIMNGLLMLSTVWPLSQIPRFVEFVSTGQVKLARREFLDLTLQSGTAAGLLAFVTGSTLVFAMDNEPSIASRIGDKSTLICLLCAFFVHHLTHCFSIVIRADRHEPMLFVNLCGAASGLAVMWLIATNNDLSQISLAYLFFTITGLIVCITYYRLSSTGRAEDLRAHDRNQKN